MKKRSSIPTEVRRYVLIEAGYRCSVPYCKIDSALDFHHIDGDPSNNERKNILVVCSNHHRACTNGRIDKKACQEIKKALAPKEINLGAGVSIDDIRELFREELGIKSSFKRITNRKKSLFPSLLDRNYLFHMSESFKYPSYELFTAIQLLGELRYKGSATKIIQIIEELRKKRVKHDDFDHFYRASIEALQKIGDNKSLNWLTNEFFRRGMHSLNRFILYLAIASSKNAKKYVGFNILEVNDEIKNKINVRKTLFSLKGKNYEISIETPLRLKERSRGTRQMTKAHLSSRV